MHQTPRRSGKGLNQGAIAALKAQELEEKTSYQGLQAPKDTVLIANGSALNQPEEPKRCIEGLTRQELSITYKGDVTEFWFCCCPSSDFSGLGFILSLTSLHGFCLKWKTSADRVLDLADSGYKYELYLSLIHKKKKDYI